MRTSSIERAQYSVDGGDWVIVMPKKRNQRRAPKERYEFSVGFAWRQAASPQRSTSSQLRALRSLLKNGGQRPKNNYPTPPELWIYPDPRDR